MVIICSPENSGQLTQSLPESHIVGEVVKQKGKERVIFK